MSDQSLRTVMSCIPVESEEERRLLGEAKKILAERGERAVIDELSSPIVDFPCELLPYLSLALQQIDDDHPFIVEQIYVPDLPAGSYTISDVNKKCQVPLLRTNCASIDDLLGGGLPVGTGGITEISGKAGVGKTQLATTLALMAPAPISKGGLETASIYACTEGRLPTSRMGAIDQALTQRLGFPPQSLLKNVVAEKLLSSDELLRWAEVRLPYLLRKTGARVVVLDSVTAVYRPEFNDPLLRADHLVKMATALRKAVAAVMGICICVNQVSQALDGFNTLNATVPALGLTWSNCVSTRLFLSRVRERRFVKVTHSCYLPVTEGPGNSFLITKDGLVADDSDNG